METTFKEIDTISFPSDLKNIALAESLIDDICQRHHISEDYYGNIIIAVTEAVNNAIQHGNKEDASKLVFLTVKENETAFVFEVKDQGNGFDYEKLPDPTAPENIEKESGRGVFLMKALADEVEFEDMGRTVVLTFNAI